MNYIQVQHFLVLSKTMNMTKAAKELYITQSALSHSISNLEEELGLKLMYRDGRHLVMTSDGYKMLEKFKTVDQTWQDLLSSADSLRHNKRPRKIRMGFYGSPTAFSALFTYGTLASWDGILIDKVFADYGLLDKMLAERKIDFAITFPPLSGDNLESQILMKDPICLAVSEDHPLLNQHKIRLKDLEKYPLLSLTADIPFARVCDSYLRRKNIHPHMERLSYNDLMKAFDEGRYGSRIVTLTTQKQFSGWLGKGYECVRISDCDESLVTAVSWRSDTDFHYEYRKFLENVAEKYDRIYYRNYRNLKVT